MNDLHLTAEIIRSLMKELRSTGDPERRQEIARQLHRLTDHLSEADRHKLTSILDQKNEHAA